MQKDGTDPRALVQQVINYLIRVLTSVISVRVLTKLATRLTSLCWNFLFSG